MARAKSLLAAAAKVRLLEIRSTATAGGQANPPVQLRLLVAFSCCSGWASEFNAEVKLFAGGQFGQPSLVSIGFAGWAPFGTLAKKRQTHINIGFPLVCFKL